MKEPSSVKEALIKLKARKAIIRDELEEIYSEIDELKEMCNHEGHKESSWHDGYVRHDCNICDKHWYTKWNLNRPINE